MKSDKPARKFYASQNVPRSLIPCTINFTIASFGVYSKTPDKKPYSNVTYHHFKGKGDILCLFKNFMLVRMCLDY